MTVSDIIIHSGFKSLTDLSKTSLKNQDILKSCLLLVSVPPTVYIHNPTED